MKTSLIAATERAVLNTKMGNTPLDKLGNPGNPIDDRCEQQRWKRELNFGSLQECIKSKGKTLKMMKGGREGEEPEKQRSGVGRVSVKWKADHGGLKTGKGMRETLAMMEECEEAERPKMLMI